MPGRRSLAIAAGAFAYAASGLVLPVEKPAVQIAAKSSTDSKSSSEPKTHTWWQLKKSEASKAKRAKDQLKVTLERKVRERHEQDTNAKATAGDAKEGINKRVESKQAEEKVEDLHRVRQAHEHEAMKRLLGGDEQQAEGGEGAQQNKGKETTTKVKAPKVLRRSVTVSKTNSVANMKAKMTIEEKRVAHEADLAHDQFALFDGKDFPSDHYAIDSIRLPDELGNVDRPKRNVQILGLQNSGTSLLRTFLYFNFGNKLRYFSDTSSEELEGGAYHARGLWRHANLKEQWSKDATLPRSLESQNVSAIVMVRNPYSWLQMMRNGTHSFTGCASEADWLITECVHPNPAGVHSEVPEAKFQSLGGVWNQWVDGYDKAQEFGFQDKLFIKYETLIKEPYSAMQSVANFLKLPKPKRDWLIPFAKITSDGPESEALAAVIDKEQNQVYLSQFAPKEKMQACQHLDTNLTAKFGYGVSDCGTFSFGEKRDDAEKQDGPGAQKPAAGNHTQAGRTEGKRVQVPKKPTLDLKRTVRTPSTKSKMHPEDILKKLDTGNEKKKREDHKDKIVKKGKL